MRRRGSQHPIEGSAAITETGAFFDEGSFASGIATYGISGDRPAGRRRGGRISLIAPDCTPIDTTWAATRPSIVIGTAATLRRRQRDCDFRASRSLRCRVARHVAPRPSRRAVAFRHSGCTARPSARSAAAHVTGARGSASSAAPGWAATRGLLFVAATPARSSTQELKQRSNPRQNEHGPARARQAMSFKSRGVAAVRFATPARSPSMQTPTRASS
jgi:hypothetical protein